MNQIGKDIRAFDNTLAESKHFFTGSMNTQTQEFDPFITGYAFIIWTKIPFWVEQEVPGFKAMSEKNFKAFDGIDDLELQIEEYQQSFNNNMYTFASSITKQNTDFQIRHQEFSGSPIKNMYMKWITGIRDPRTDIATYPAKYGCDYAAKNHTGELLYVVTRPDVNNFDSKRNIEFALYYTNVIPTKVPLSHMNYSQGDHSSPEIEIPFRGTMHMSAKVDDYAYERLKEAYTFRTEGMFDPNPSEATKFNSSRLGDKIEYSTEEGGPQQTGDIPLGGHGGNNNI